MRPTFQIIICCLYALSAVNATPFSKRGSAEVQQGNTNAAKPLNFWSDDKNDDDDKEDKWSKDGKDDKDNKEDHDECASRSVSVLIGTSTYAIPCLQGDSIVNLNGLIPTPTSSIASSSATEASSSTVSSSAVDSSSAANSSSSEASSATDSTTTNTHSTTTTDSSTATMDSTTATTTSTDTTTTTTTTTLPTGTNVILYDSVDCTGDIILSNSGLGCFNDDISVNSLFSAGSSSANADILVQFFASENCRGRILSENVIMPDGCAPNIDIGGVPILSFSVTEP